MQVRELMKREVASIGPNSSLALAARTMRDQDVGCLPVIEGGRLIGMITDRDIIVRAVAEGLDPHRTTVREAMSAERITCSIEQTIDEAHEIMTANLVKHLPVVDSRERVVGLVSLRDMVGQFPKCRPHRVTFYKRLASSSGHLRNVEVARVYLSPAIQKEDVVATALAKFEQDRGLARWDQVADVYEFQERN